VFVNSLCQHLSIVLFINRGVATCHLRVPRAVSSV